MISTQGTETITIIDQLIKHLNYSEIALDQYKVNLIMGGPESDFEGFAMDRDSWNVVTLKLEVESTRLDHYNSVIPFFDWIVSFMGIKIGIKSYKIIDSPVHRNGLANLVLLQVI